MVHYNNFHEIVRSISHQHFHSRMSSGPKIAIVGAGIAGLTLAFILNRGGIPYTVYEADKSRKARKQGGPVNIHYERGERVLRALGLFDIYLKKLVSPGSEVNCFGDENGHLFLDHSCQDGKLYAGAYAPLVDRIAVRHLLLNSIPTDSVRWDSKVLDISPASSNTYDITFVDGSCEKGFDLIVGADGAWSKVRSLLTDVKPFYSGYSYMETEIQNIPAAPPEVLHLIKRGSYYFQGAGSCLVAQRDGDRSIWMYAIVQKPENWVKDHGFDLNDIAGTKKQFLEQDWSEWHEDLKAIIANADADLTPRPFYMLPVGHTWKPRAGVTLVGDAGHLMTPFGGAGANLALEDGYELGEALVSQGRRELLLERGKFTNHKGLSAALQRYEVGMFPRAETEAARTVSNMEAFFVKGAAERLVGIVKSMSV